MPIHRCLRNALPRYVLPSLTSPSPHISRVLLMLGWGLDLFWSYVSLYNTTMKVFFITSSLYILYLMKGPFRPTFDPNIDTFKFEFLVLGAFAASMVFNYEYSLSEVHAPPPIAGQAGADYRCFGPSVFGWKAWPFCLNYSLFRGLVRPRISRRITSLHLARTAHCTFQIGFTGITQTTTLILLLRLLESSR